MKNLKFIAAAFFALFLSSAWAFDPTEMTEQDANCLTRAIYHEARGEGEKGMFAVAAVVVNRARHYNFASDICSVVHQRGQFTFDKKARMSESSSVWKTQRVVEVVRSGFMPLYDFLYFHRTDVIGQCTNKKRKMKIGSHYFCE